MWPCLKKKLTKTEGLKKVNLGTFFGRCDGFHEPFPGDRNDLIKTRQNTTKKTQRKTQHLPGNSAGDLFGMLK